MAWRSTSSSNRIAPSCVKSCSACGTGGCRRGGGTVFPRAAPPGAHPADGLAVDFVVESNRAQLREIVQRVRDGRLRTNIGTVSPLADAVAAFNQTGRRKGKTIIRVR